MPTKSLSKLPKSESEPEPEPEPEPKNRMVAENGVDLDEKSDTTQHRQGNAYGVSPDAAANFRDAAIRRIAELTQEIEYYKAQANKWNDSLSGTKYHKKEI